MKKLLSIVFIVAGILIALVSCKKSEDFTSVQKEQVRIFTSSPDQSGLKSASVGTQIFDGDTIDQPRDINCLTWAVTEFGEPISGEWRVDLVYSDFLDMPQGNYATSTFVKLYAGSQIANKFIECGLYKITFGKFVNYSVTETLLTYYARVGGIPGKVGDGYENNYIFRIEKKSLFNYETLKQEDLIFLYYKFYLAPKPGNAWCFLTLRINGQNRSTQHSMKKWQFSNEGYYYLLLPVTSGVEYYQAVFVLSNDGLSGPVDVNTNKSSWNKDGDGIYFSIQ